jgi:chromosome segregation ATPase
MTNGQTMERVRENTLRSRKHQTPGKRVGTKNDTSLMGSHVATVAVSEQRSTLSDSTRVAQFKVEALDRDIARLALRHKDLRRKLHEVQERHMERREHIQTLQHNSRKCLASLATLYIDEAENIIKTDTHILEQYLQGLVGVG